MLAELVIQKLLSAIGRDGREFTGSTLVQANLAISQACQEYILGKVKVIVSYLGSTPSGTPDIVPQASLPVIGVVSPPSGTSFEAWWNSLWTLIQGGIFIGSGLVIPSSLVNAFTGSPQVSFPLGPGTQEEVWGKIANSLETWFTSPSQSGRTFPASRPGSVGTATIIKITV